MSRTKNPTGEQKEVTKHYLSSIRRSMQRLDVNNFDHYNLAISDERLIRYILAKAYVLKRHVPALATEILLKGLKDDKSFQDYIDNDLEISISTETAMELRIKNRIADKAERDKGHSHFTAL